MQTEMLKAANAVFTEVLKEKFCQNGYFLKDGVFRKIRGKHLFIIEAELTFREGEPTVVCPVVRVADTRVKRRKDGSFRTDSGILDNEATVEAIKQNEKKAFYKTLRHLKETELHEGENLTEEQIKEIAKSCFVAAPVCENRAIPAEYKRLCKNDVPFGNALAISAISAFGFFVILTLLIGLLAGIAVWAALGFTRIFGLFAVPYFYLCTAAAAIVYWIISFRKLRSGRF